MILKDCGSYYLGNENPVNDKIILTCEHGGKLIPDGYGTLGLSDADMDSTITHDVGAADVAVALAERLGCKLFLGKYSRIFIDLNRAVYNSQLIKATSHTVPVAGNTDLDDAEYLKRINEYYWPYRLAIDGETVKNDRLYILSVHSFTPRPRFMKTTRPWHVCVGFSERNAFSDHILNVLSRDKSLVVGENKPFNLRKKYKNGNGIAYKYGKKMMNAVLFEIRNDFIQTPSSRVEWAERIYSLIPDIVK